MILQIWLIWRLLLQKVMGFFDFVWNSRNKYTLDIAIEYLLPLILSAYISCILVFLIARVQHYSFSK